MRLSVPFRWNHILTVRKFRHLAVQPVWSKIRPARVNTKIVCVAKAWLHGCVVTQLRDAIFDLLK